MPGSPTFGTAQAYGGYPAPTPPGPVSGGGSHTAFIVWVVLIGVILPAFILGGLQMGGFSFVFKGR